MGTVRGYYKIKPGNIVKLKKYISEKISSEDPKKHTNNGGDN